MLRIMIVDDEELAVKRLKRMLAERGEIGEIESFLNPRDAYEYAKTHPVDVAFLDISMPDVNGMRLSSLLLEIQSAVDIVFVTGSDEYAVKAYEMSALDYIMKPVTFERLASTMEKIRRMRRIVATGSPLEVRLFNGLNIQLQAAGGAQETIKLRSPKTEELFAFLVCKRAVSREEIVDTLWSGLAPDKAWKNLNSTLYYVRKAIDIGESGSIIATAGNEIRLKEDGLYCDLYEFERNLKEIRRDSDRQGHLLERSEALYAGSLLQGKSYDWAIEYSRRLERQYIELLELSARRDRQLSQPLNALHKYSEILKLDGIREDIHMETIRLYMELGRKHDALRQYRELEELLQRELGAMPDPKIKELLS